MDDDVRYVPITCDPDVCYIVQTPDFSLFVTELLVGCECHPQYTLITQRRHCLN